MMASTPKSLLGVEHTDGCSWGKVQTPDMCIASQHSALRQARTIVAATRIVNGGTVIILPGVSGPDVLSFVCW